ncbi:MAG: vitamin K epoxide reductase family protein [Chloroflexi bacterium]|nr:MAG: vitamin K epoxide reductase family protein [Chloroflexota bacterium]
MDWPDIPGLREALSQSQEADNSTATAPTQPSEADNPTAIAPTQSATLQITPVPATVSPSFVSPVATPGIIPTDHSIPNWRDNLTRDPAGNTLAIIVLIGMLAAVVWAVFLFKKANGISLRGRWSWIIPILCIIGFGVAGYLAYVETAQVTAVCGPVGDCNTVQQSEYARLFGILSIGMLGLIGYEAIIIAWLVARFTTGRLADLAGISLFIMPFFGTLFSIYLTFLEPFVIGATCAWCLTSAVLMTVLMLLTIGPAKLAFSRNPFAASLRQRHKQLGVHDD